MGDTVVVTIACSECKERNYSFRRNSKKEKEKLEIQKFCPRCKKRTLHKKTK